MGEVILPTNATQSLAALADQTPVDPNKAHFGPSDTSAHSSPENPANSQSVAAVVVETKVAPAVAPTP